MNKWDLFSASPEMRRRHQSFQVWRRVVVAVIVVGWLVFGYVGYRILTHFGIL